MSGPACWSLGKPVPAPIPVKAANLGGAVSILAAHLADALKLCQAGVSVNEQVFHLIYGQLIQQGIPLRVVEVSAQLVAQLGGLSVILDLQAVLGTGGDGLISLIDVAVRHVGGVEVQRLDIVGHSAAGGVGLGEGARKVSAGHVGDVLVGVAAVQADTVNGIAAGELVGNRVPVTVSSAYWTLAGRLQVMVAAASSSTSWASWRTVKM